MSQSMHSGPVVIGFDGTPTAEHALRQSASLLAPRPALVVVVWEAGRAFELLTLPVRALEAPVSVDVGAALEAEKAVYEDAEPRGRAPDWPPSSVTAPKGWPSPTRARWPTHCFALRQNATVKRWSSVLMAIGA